MTPHALKLWKELPNQFPSKGAFYESTPLSHPEKPKGCNLAPLQIFPLRLGPGRETSDEDVHAGMLAPHAASENKGGVSRLSKRSMSARAAKGKATVTATALQAWELPAGVRIASCISKQQAFCRIHTTSRTPLHIPISKSEGEDGHLTSLQWPFALAAPIRQFDPIRGASKYARTARRRRP